MEWSDLIYTLGLWYMGIWWLTALALVAEYILKAKTKFDWYRDLFPVSAAAIVMATGWFLIVYNMIRNWRKSK